MCLDREPESSVELLTLGYPASQSLCVPICWCYCDIPSPPLHPILKTYRNIKWEKYKKTQEKSQHKDLKEYELLSLEDLLRFFNLEENENMKNKEWEITFRPLVEHRL